MKRAIFLHCQWGVLVFFFNLKVAEKKIKNVHSDCKKKQKKLIEILLEVRARKKTKKLEFIMKRKS